MNANPRYQGKPLLRLLECYVLSAIGALTETEQTTLQTMAPKLQTIYGVPGGNWQQIIAAVAELPPNLPALIQDMWRKNTEIARQHGVELTPQQFAEMFVDQNLT